MLDYLAQLAELSPDAVVAADPEGRIVLANTRAEELFDYAPEQLATLSVEALMPARFRAEHRQQRRSFVHAWRRRMMGEGPLDLFGCRRDGSEFPAEIALMSVETDGGTMTVAAVRDISKRLRTERERAELQAQLAREQSAAQASRMESLGQLAGGIAHDFNNLLSVVIGNVELLVSQLTPASAEHEEAVEILGAATRAATLTRQLLTFSRREVSKPVPVDLNATVVEVHTLLERTLREHVTLRTSLAQGLPLMLGDPDAVEQILLNLSVNARDAMPDGGTLTISTAAVQIGAQDAPSADLSPGDYVRLSVTDTGTGMPADVARRAFEPFFTTKPKTQETGLGLATVYGIARQAGGQARIESEVGRGTTVTVDMPALPADGVDEPKAAASASS
ncbi:MAG: two-component system sensor histidine kinase NtrB [Solirubrobacteraceae bacterium]